MVTVAVFNIFSQVEVFIFMGEKQSTHRFPAENVVDDVKVPSVGNDHIQSCRCCLQISKMG